MTRSALPRDVIRRVVLVSVSVRVVERQLQSSRRTVTRARRPIASPRVVIRACVPPLVVR